MRVLDGAYRHKQTCAFVCFLVIDWSHPRSCGFLRAKVDDALAYGAIKSRFEKLRESVRNGKGLIDPAERKAIAEKAGPCVVVRLSQRRSDVVVSGGIPPAGHCQLAITAK